MDKKFIEMIYQCPEYYNIVKNTIISIKPNINDFDLKNCISEVYITAMKKQNLENHPNIKGWLYLTASNVVKRLFDDYKKENQFIVPLDENIPNTHDFVDKIEDNELNRELIKKLPLTRSERKLFELKYTLGHTNKEISVILKVKEASVNMKCTRLKKKLKKFYESV